MVLSLTDLSLKILAHNLDAYTEWIITLPTNIKEKLLRLLGFLGNITDFNLIQLVHADLRSLNVSNCRISDSSLSLIHCRQLRKLFLSGCVLITSTGLEALASQCAELREVDLTGCVSISDAGVQALAQNCKRLEVLLLGQCSAISDRTLIEVGANCSFLYSICFSTTQVTDEGVKALVAGVCSQSLKEIEMVRCKKITDQAVIAVFSNCKNIKIFCFHECPLLTDRSTEALHDFFTGQNRMQLVSWTV